MRMRTALAAVGLWVLLAVPVQANTLIDTAPFDWEFSYAEWSGPDTAGGTFTAVEPLINHFSLFLGVEGGLQSNSLQACHLLNRIFCSTTTLFLAFLEL